MKHHCDLKIIKQTDQIIIERCNECRKKVKTIKGKSGRINSKKFLSEHIRDFCQTTGNTQREFKKYYGKQEDFKRTQSQEDYEKE